VGRVQRAPDGLSWRAVQGARGYVVELLDGDGELLWKSEELSTVQAPWPKAEAGTPGRYYWRVLAVPEGGGEAVPSPLKAIDIGITASHP